MLEEIGSLPAAGDPGESALPVRFDSVGYGRDGATLLADINATLRAGTRTVVMGPNGAGKSLLLRLLQGLIQPETGDIRWNRARDKKGAPRAALVLQRPVLLRRSVEANLAHALATYGVPKTGRAAVIDALLAAAGLNAQRKQPARSLSGGEQQRLATVRALACTPDLLLLDEPTANLDPHATRAIESLIEQAFQRGTKPVLVTHDIGQAKRIADDVIFMAAGRVTEVTEAATFFDGPQSAEARAYLAGELIL